VRVDFVPCCRIERVARFERGKGGSGTRRVFEIDKVITCRDVDLHNDNKVSTRCESREREREL